MDIGSLVPCLVGPDSFTLSMGLVAYPISLVTCAIVVDLSTLAMPLILLPLAIVGITIGHYEATSPMSLVLVEPALVKRAINEYDLSSALPDVLVLHPLSVILSIVINNGSRPILNGLAINNLLDLLIGDSVIKLAQLKQPLVDVDVLDVDLDHGDLGLLVLAAPDHVRHAQADLAQLQHALGHPVHVLTETLYRKPRKSYGSWLLLPPCILLLSLAIILLGRSSKNPRNPPIFIRIPIVSVQ